MKLTSCTFSPNAMLDHSRGLYLPPFDWDTQLGDFVLHALTMLFFLDALVEHLLHWQFRADWFKGGSLCKEAIKFAPVGGPRRSNWPSNGASGPKYHTMCGSCT